MRPIWRPWIGGLMRRKPEWQRSDSTMPATSPGTRATSHSEPHRFVPVPRVGDLLPGPGSRSSSSPAMTSIENFVQKYRGAAADDARWKDVPTEALEERLQDF